MSFGDGCYIASIGEVVALQGLNAGERNGLLGKIEGIQNGRIVVRQLHDDQCLLVLPKNLLEAGGDCMSDEDGADISNETGDGSDDDDFTMEDDYADEDCVSEDNTDEAEGGGNSFDQSLVDANIVEANRLLKSSVDISTEYELGKILEAAKQYCNRALVTNSENWVAYQMIGDISTKQLENEEAAAAFRSQLEVLNNLSTGSRSKVVTTAMLNLAGALGRLGDTAGELQTLQRAADINPNNAYILANIGTLKLDSEEIDDAVHWFQSAAAADPTWALGRFHLARALLQKGDRAEAIGHLEAAVTECVLKRTDETAQRAARTYMMIADAMCAAGMEKSPKIVMALLRSVNIMQSEIAPTANNLNNTTGKTCAAQAYYQLGLALEAHCKQPGGGGDVSSPVESIGYRNGAIGAFKRACDLDSTEPAYFLALGNAQRMRAHTLRSNEDLAVCMVTYRKGLAIDSTNASLYRNLGAALMQTGDVANSIAAFNASLVNSEEDDPLRPQIQQIVRDLTEKLRQRQQGTIVVDLPR